MNLISGTASGIINTAEEQHMHVYFHRPFISENEINAVNECMRSGWLTMGKKVSEFEQRFNEYLGAKNSVAVNSCTAALHLAFCCVGLEEGDEVIVPTTTFTATAEVLRYFKARPVMVDIERDTHLIDAAKIEEKITKKTKAIIPVHFAGQPADMDAIQSIAEKHRLFVIEDAAHSLPSRYKGKFIGTIGDVTCFSFYATKTLTTAEGGMAVTTRDQWADKMRKLRLHGISRDTWTRLGKENIWQYDVIDAGYKYNTTDINAAMGIEQLKKNDLMNSLRTRIAEKYSHAFKDNDAIILYHVKKERETCWYLYPVKLNLQALSIDRNQFVDELYKRGIETSVHFIPLYKFSYYRELGYDRDSFPASDWVFDRTFSLPIYPGMKENEVDYVIDNVLDVIKKHHQ